MKAFVGRYAEFSVCTYYAAKCKHIQAYVPGIKVYSNCIGSERAVRDDCFKVRPLEIGAMNGYSLCEYQVWSFFFEWDD